MTRVSIALGVLIACGPTWAGAQGLADVARAEEARRKTVAKASKIYTNSDLKSDAAMPATPSAPPASMTGADPAAPAAAGVVAAEKPGANVAAKGEAYWSGRMKDAREALDRSRTFAEALQSRINALTTDFTNRDDPAQRSVIEQNRNKALEELGRVQKDISAQTKAIADIEDEARRAGVPSGWLR